MRHIAFSDLRARLAQTLSDVQDATEPLLISRRGEVAAVLMSVAQYQRLLRAEDDSPFQRWQAWREAARADGFFDAPDETDPWANVRDRQPWRPVPWSGELPREQPAARIAAEPATPYRTDSALADPPDTLRATPAAKSHRTRQTVPTQRPRKTRP